MNNIRLSSLGMRALVANFYSVIISALRAVEHPQSNKKFYCIPRNYSVKYPDNKTIRKNEHGKRQKEIARQAQEKEQGQRKNNAACFAQAVLTQAQSRLFRTMHIAEQAILEPSDELHGIAIPSVN